MTWNVSEKRGLVLIWRAFGDDLIEMPIEQVLESNQYFYKKHTEEFGPPAGIIKTYKILTEIEGGM